MAAPSAVDLNEYKYNEIEVYTKGNPQKAHVGRLAECSSNGISIALLNGPNLFCYFDFAPQGKEAEIITQIVLPVSDHGVEPTNLVLYPIQSRL